MSLYTDHPTYESENLIISSICYQSYPCMHYCVYNGENKPIYAEDIVLLIKKEGGIVPKHFKYAEELIEKKEWLVTTEELDVETLISHRLYSKDNKYKSELLTASIVNNRLDVVVRVLDDIDPTYEDLITASKDSFKNLDMFKLLTSKLKDPSIINKTGMEYIGHGGKTILSMAAYHGNLELVKYLIEEKESKMSEDVMFSLKHFIPSELRDYIVEKMIEQKCKVYDPYNRLRILRFIDSQSGEGADVSCKEFFEYLVANDVLKRLEYNIVCDYPGSQLVSTRNPNLYYRKYKDDAGPDDIMMSSLFNFDVLCNTRITGMCEHSIVIQRVSHFMVKNFRIKFTFTNTDTSIVSYYIECNHSNLYLTDVSNNEIVFEPLEPFYNGSACFGCTQLHIWFDAPSDEDTYITDVHMVANMVDAMSISNEKNPLDYKFKITDSITASTNMGIVRVID
jgi:hypothetical protein